MFWRLYGIHACSVLTVYALSLNHHYTCLIVFPDRSNITLVTSLIPSWASWTRTRYGKIGFAKNFHYKCVYVLGHIVSRLQEDVVQLWHGGLEGDVAWGTELYKCEMSQFTDTCFMQVLMHTIWPVMLYRVQSHWRRLQRDQPLLALISKTPWLP